MTWRGSAVDDHRIGPPAGQRRGDGCFGVETFAPLVERRDLQIGAEAHAAAIGGKHAGEQIDQRRFAGAVRSDDADAGAAGDLHAEILHQSKRAIAFGDLLRLDHLLAGFFRLLHRQHHLALRAAVLHLLASVAKRQQRFETALVAFPPSADAVAQPVLLLHDAAVELVAFDLLRLQDRIAPRLESGEALVEPPRGAAVEPHRRLRQVLQETPVVADQHDGRAHDLERRLQTLDGHQVEMVGGLVEQQYVGLRRQHAGERCTPAFAAGQPRRFLSPGEAEALQQIACAVRIIAGGEPGLDESEGRGEAGQVRALRQIADRHAGLDEAAAGIRVDHSSSNLEQRRLARAVAADQTQTLGRADRERGAGEQRRAAEGKADVLKKEEGRRHGLAVLRNRRGESQNWALWGRRKSPEPS